MFNHHFLHLRLAEHIVLMYQTVQIVVIHFDSILMLEKATAYTTGVTVGSGYVDLEVTDSTPTVLHYQCSSHGYMGNAIQVNSSNAIKLNSQAASYYLDYDNFSNTPTIPSNNNQLTNGAGYITTSFTNTNQLTNGAGFITASDNITGTCN